MLVEFGHANLLDKARQQPDKVRMVLDKVRTDGLMPTLEAVKSKLDQPLPMGYCNVGVVDAVGVGVDDFQVGDRVASNGRHAEYVLVPRNLCARIPDSVTDEDAVFTVMGAIALQGMRLAAPTLGESVVVIGLGLIGLLTVQLLKAQGCRVLGIDFHADKLDLARRFGAEVCNPQAGEDPVAVARAFSRGRGVDAVLVTASTDSSEPMHQAAQMSRQRGRIVLVGVAGLALSRADFYTKELSFQVSCSYGPGRYDPLYEEQGQDYPLGFVRWTEQRNFEAVLDMLAAGAIDVAPLITSRHDLEKAADAYELLRLGNPLGIVLQYVSGDAVMPSRRLRVSDDRVSGRAKGEPRLAVLGAGNYGMRVLIPAFKAADAQLVSVVSGAGVSAVLAARKHGISEARTDTAECLTDLESDTVVIVTRHDAHARQVCTALDAGKHVFVEKPLALTLDELDAIEASYATARTRDGGKPMLMVGFNRRFAPQIEKIKTLLDGVSEPKVFVMTVNAGEIPADHWTQDFMIGGGRLIGEACHFIDLFRHLAGAPISRAEVMAVGRVPGVAVRDDKVSILLAFEDGSMGTVHYLANGHKSFPKERLEVFAAGRILQLDNFRRLRGYGWPGFRRMNLMRQNKGNSECVAAFMGALRDGGAAPIAFDELMEVSRLSVQLANQVRD